MVKHVRSNAVVFARDGAVVAVGAGQMSRVDSVVAATHVARRSAPEGAAAPAAGSVMATDGFFPCPDAVEEAAAAGATAIAHGRRALNAGANAIAATPPYYYSNAQSELTEHYRAIRSAVDAPLFVYNIPSTVKVKVEVESIVTLAAEGTVVGIKDSQNDLDFARTLSMAANERGVPLRLFLGTRSLIDAALLVGAHGCIPGIANVVPRACLDAYEAAARGDFPVALRAQQRVVDALAITRVVRGSAQAAGMGGMKAALKAMGVIASSNVALPLASPTEEDEARITGIARNLGLHFLTPA